ncbi:YjjG family noncanonical pyrimidine nucleotidase [Paenibacillus nasutitermitis]|uniref:dUMP phosphatase n=1 Tax=Paenibacillus nasutitermitis TaxID=1652958 RepID=A0A916YQF4_9BACL|nr:YjjG family noncanonical pyrimidine nucleotidase [Paenibacillus nasutitermitis]GGD55813.1 dUMP phosphatase [Paenibacillus nasutitermitis]
MYKAILFDLDNTLLDYDFSEQDSMKRTIEHHRQELADFQWDLFRSTFGPINWTYWIERVQRNLTIGEVLHYSFRDTLEQLGHDHAISPRLAQTYWTLFCSTCHLMEGADELLGKLHGSYRMGIISNGIGEAQRGRLKKGMLDHYFDHLFISDEVGFYKPHREIFDTAVRTLGVDHSEVLFVGDSLQDDYHGAAGAGIDFCYYNPLAKPLGQSHRPAYMIHSLSELIHMDTHNQWIKRTAP